MHCHCTKCRSASSILCTWYTEPVALDLQAISRAIAGSCVSQRLGERTPVDGVSPIEAFVVVGNPEYATLVTGDAEELLRRLAAARATASNPDGGGSAGDDGNRGVEDPLLSAVFVTDSDTAELRAALERCGMTAILGARHGGTALHATLTALIADDRAAADRLVTAGINVLTQVARRGGVTAVIAELAHRLDGWAVLLDAQGQLIGSAGAGRLHVSDAVAVALGRPVRVRHVGLQLHQVGSDSDLAGYLVVASRSRSRTHSRDLAAQSAALLDLLLRTHDPSLTEHLGREALIATLDAGGPPARELLRRWEVHEPSLTAFALGTKTRTVDLERLLRRWLDELGAEHMFASGTGPVRGFVRNELAEQLAKLVEALRPMGGARVHLGLGAPAPAEALAQSAVQARQALDTALEDGETVHRYTQLPTVDLVLSSLTGTPSDALTSLLDPLRDASGAHGELAHTLRVFLAEHGGHRASARRLDIHRQTLAARIRRVEELTGLSMDRADDRTAAWLALRAAGF